MNNYIVYFKNASGKFRIWNSTTQEITTQNTIPNKINQYYLTKGYEATDKDLIKYAQDIKEASAELLTSNVFKFDYIKAYKMKDGNLFYASHTSNIESLFKMCCKLSSFGFEPIGELEDKWFEKCYNSGLMFSKPGIIDSYGYDFTMCYGNILADEKFIIPLREGKEVNLKKLPTKIKFGLYRVIIKSDHPDIKKCFSFSKHNVYTSIDLKFIMKLQEQFNITIELIIDNEPNALVYKLDDQIKGSKVFKKWLDTVKALKAEFPKNILIKMLATSLWGHLSKRKIFYKADEEAEKLLKEPNSPYVILDYVIKHDGSSFYTLQNKEQLYAYPLRLKPFIKFFICP